MPESNGYTLYIEVPFSALVLPGRLVDIWVNQDCGSVCLHQTNRSRACCQDIEVSAVSKDFMREICVGMWSISIKKEPPQCCLFKGGVNDVRRYCSETKGRSLRALTIPMDYQWHINWSLWWHPLCFYCNSETRFRLIRHVTDGAKSRLIANFASWPHKKL